MYAMHVCYHVCVKAYIMYVCVCTLVCMHCMCAHVRVCVCVCVCTCACVCVVCLCNVQWNVHMQQHDHYCLHSQLDLCLNICTLMTLYGSKVLDFCKLGFDFPYTYSKFGIHCLELPGYNAYGPDCHPPPRV